MYVSDRDREAVEIGSDGVEFFTAPDRTRYWFEGEGLSLVLVEDPLGPEKPWYTDVFDVDGHWSDRFLDVAADLDMPEHRMPPECFSQHALREGRCLSCSATFTLRVATVTYTWQDNCCPSCVSMLTAEVS